MQNAGANTEKRDHLLEVTNVSKSFGTHRVLHDISFKVRPGEVVAIIGPSGTGKSTLLRCINGLEPIDAGNITFENTSVPAAGRRITELRTHIGMVFQEFNLFPHMTVLQNLLIGPVHAKKTPKPIALERANKLLEQVGLSDKSKAFPLALSGGQKQRVAIARALAMQPKLMLFDEATSALDPELVREVLDVMRELATGGMTMLVVTHEMRFAHEACSRVIFMDAGHIIEDANPAQFFTSPRTERAMGFLNTVNQP